MKLLSTIGFAAVILLTSSTEAGLFRRRCCKSVHKVKVVRHDCCGRHVYKCKHVEKCCKPKCVPHCHGGYCHPGHEPEPGVPGVE